MSGKFSKVPRDHPIELLTNRLVLQASELSKSLKMTQWEMCVALANTCGHILGGFKDMPRDVAMERFDDLCTVMKTAYEMADVVGEA